MKNIPSCNLFDVKNYFTRLDLAPIEASFHFQKVFSESVCPRKKQI
jgi:hypothetical protein